MDTEKILKYISKKLMRHEAVVSDTGLLHGKMGFAVFFSHYAQHTGNPSYTYHAMELINDILEQAQKQYEINYANGLAGIGAGIEYLSQNKLIDVNTHEILEYFDGCIFRSTVFSEHTDASLYTGLTGLARYPLFRIAGRHTNEDQIRTLDNKMLLIHITDMLERMSPSSKEAASEDVLIFLHDMEQANVFPEKIKRMIKDFSSARYSTNQDTVHAHQLKIETLYSKKYHDFFSKIRNNPQSDMIPDLYGGLAGIGLYLLSKSDKRHESWMKLL